MKIPLHSLVIMIGPSGAGKSSLARRLFDDYEIVSTDQTRYELFGTIERQDSWEDVFALCEQKIKAKLSVGERVVIDATNLHAQDRKKWVDVGKSAGVPVFYMVYCRPLEEVLASKGERMERTIVRHHTQFISGEKLILSGDGGIARVIDARIEDIEVVKKPSWESICRDFSGVMTIGDVHNESEALLEAVKYANERNLFVVSLGDILDYGPDPVECVNIMHNIVSHGRGLMVIGNHEYKNMRIFNQLDEAQAKGLLRLPENIRVKMSYGSLETYNKVEMLSKKAHLNWLNKFRSLYLMAPYVIRLGNMTMTHGAFLHPSMMSTQHRPEGRTQQFALFGETTGESKSEDGKPILPVRIYDWVDAIPEGHLVVVGHDYSLSMDGQPFMSENSTGGKVYFADTGCGKGGPLSTLTFNIEDNKLVFESVKQFFPLSYNPDMKDEENETPSP